MTITLEIFSDEIFILPHLSVGWDDGEFFIYAGWLAFGMEVMF